MPPLQTHAAQRRGHPKEKVHTKVSTSSKEEGRKRLGIEPRPRKGKKKLVAVAANPNETPAYVEREVILTFHPGCVGWIRHPFSQGVLLSNGWILLAENTGGETGGILLPVEINHFWKNERKNIATF